MTDAGMFAQMKRRRQCTTGPAGAFALAAVLWLSPGCGIGAAAADQIKIGGTGSALGVVGLLAREFAVRHPRIEVVFVPNLGSEGGIRALAGGAINLALISRALTPSERRPGVAEIEFARTPFVFAVSARSRVRAVTLAELADIYAGKLTQWPDGTPVRVVLRPQSDVDTAMVKNLSPAIRLALAAAEQRPGVRFSVTDQSAAQDVETIRGAIGTTTLAIIFSERRMLRALQLEGKDPTLANAVAGVYPHYKRLFFVIGADRPLAVDAFIAFARSSAGREILGGNGCWVVRDRP